jgi:tetratricopeptide (TPR) repeat protein
MARKRLNKKVAVIGIIIFAALLMGAAYTFLALRKNPEKLIGEAESQWRRIEGQLAQYGEAVKAGGGANDQTNTLLQAGQDAYIEMLTTYRQAFGSARNDALRITILFTLADYYLKNNAFHAPDWDKALRSWHTVTTIDPGHIEARMQLLRYFYDAGDSGNRAAWARVKEQADEIMQRGGGQPDIFVLKARARANFEVAGSGEVTNPAETVQEAITGFESLAPTAANDPDIHRYLADAIMLRGRLGESIGQADAVRQALEQALAVLQQAADGMPDNVQARVNLLNRKLAAAQGEATATKALEADYEALTARFAASAEAFAAQSAYYQVCDRLDDAIAAMDRAMTLDPESVTYAATAASLLYFKASTHKDKALLAKAIELANRALTLPDAQDVGGPRQLTHVSNRAGLHSFLAKVYVEEALEADEAGDAARRQDCIQKAEASVHELTQIYGEANVYSTMWTGILGMAGGKGAPAVAQMVDAYQQLRAAGRSDVTLAYLLAKAFEESPEVGSRMQFLRDAITGGAASGQPELLLDYADLLLTVRAWASVVSLAETYENTLAPTHRSEVLRGRANIGAGQFDGAAQILAGMDGGNTQTRGLELELVDARILRALQIQAQQSLPGELEKQLEADLARRAVLVDELLAADATQVSFQTVANLCSQYLGEDKADKARELIAAFLAKNPDYGSAKVYQRQLMEPDPLDVSAERRDQIALEVLSQIGDALERQVSTGEYHLRRGQYSEATAAYSEALRVQPDDQRAIDGLFETILVGRPDNLDEAQALAETARTKNLDQCEGNFYLARLAYARKDYQEALNRIEQCLKMRPIYAHAYYLRSQVNAALDKHEQSVQDAQTASQMNPTDPVIAKQKAAVLHARNLQLGAAVTGEQREETETAMREAILLNPMDWSVQSVYAEYRSERHPEEALAQRQYLARRFPNLANHLLLGNMAMKMGLRESDEPKKAGLMEIAGSAYEQAYAIEPGNPAVQQQYSEFLRATGQHAKAETLFSGNEAVLWRYYLRDGRYDQARALLEALYAKDPKDASVVRGLAVVAQQTGDKDGVKRYSEELLAIESTIDDQLLQIQMYLDVGLIKDADMKLAGLRERHPAEPRAMLLQSLVLMTQGRLDEAMDMVNRNLEVDTENAQAWRLRGRINRLKGNTAQAVEDLQKSRGLSGGAAISLELAMAYRQANRMAAAIGELRSALRDELAPLRLRTMLEQFYMDAGQKDELTKFYAETIAKHPESEFWYYRAAQFYLQDQDSAKAEELLAKAWEITRTKDAPSPIVFDLYLETLWMRERYDTLLGIASQYTDTGLASIAYAQMGQTQAKLGNREAAVQHYHKAMEKCGSDDALISGTLRNMTQAVGTDEIEKWATQRLAETPESLIANMAMFHLAGEKGDYNTALTHLDRGIAAVAAGSGPYNHYMVLKAVTFVQAYIKTRDTKYLAQGIEQYEAVLVDQPQNVSALNNLAFLLADTNEQLDKAETYAARAYAAAPDNANIMDTYAYVLCKRTNFARAEELLLKALQLYELEGRTAPAEVYKHLGMAQEGLQRKALAAESYRRALEVGGASLSEPEKIEINEALQRVSQ